MLSDIMVQNKGIPKEDGTGRGRRDNINRGGCNSPPPIGKGRDGKKGLFISSNPPTS